MFSLRSRVSLPEPYKADLTLCPHLVERAIKKGSTKKADIDALVDRLVLGPARRQKVKEAATKLFATLGGGETVSQEPPKPQTAAAAEVDQHEADQLSEEEKDFHLSSHVVLLPLQPEESRRYEATVTYVDQRRVPGTAPKPGWDSDSRSAPPPNYDR